MILYGSIYCKKLKKKKEGKKKKKTGSWQRWFATLEVKIPDYFLMHQFSLVDFVLIFVNDKTKFSWRKMK